MEKLNYGNYNSSITDIAYSATNGYSNPASELETRKQLSYPLKEIKDCINNTLASKCVVVSSTFSSLPTTINNANITEDHVAINAVLSNQSAQTSDWTIVTENGSLTISGSISGSTTATLYLVEKI
jgi:hypothetical protein